MSYCRFSSDDFQCDVYVYADVDGGYTTHVAARKRRHDIALPPQVPFDKEHLTEWMARREAVDKILDSIPLVPIGLPHDGARFNDTTAAECADRLESLKALGYQVPQYAIDALREDAKEEE